MNLAKNIAFFIFAFLSLPSHAQWSKKVEATNVRLAYVNEKVEITYDITGRKNEKYYVSVSFFNQSHHKLIASVLYGDVGTIISSGAEKKIIWDIKKDYPSFNDNVNAEISVITIESLNTNRILLSSALFPGSGSTRLTGSKIYLVNGILYYGCLTGSLWLAYKSKSYYHSYKNSFDINKRNAFYDKAENNRKLSINLLYAGTGLFILNYGLTYLNITRSAKKYKGLRNAKLSLNFLNYGSPVLSYNLNF
jgi:hypothetical protein